MIFTYAWGPSVILGGGSYDASYWGTIIQWLVISFLPLHNRGIAKLSISGGQERNIFSFFLILLLFSLIFLNFSLFTCSIWGPGERFAHRWRSTGYATGAHLCHLKDTNCLRKTCEIFMFTAIFNLISSVRLP